MVESKSSSLHDAAEDPDIVAAFEEAVEEWCGSIELLVADLVAAPSLAR